MEKLVFNYKFCLFIKHIKTRNEGNINIDKVYLN